MPPLVDHHYSKYLWRSVEHLQRIQHLGETICLGERIRPASADFPPAGGVWGGMRAEFRISFLKNFECAFNGLTPKNIFYLSER